MRFFLAHGFRADPHTPPWLQWFKNGAEENGHVVHLPAFPTPEKPNANEWIHTIDKELEHNYEEVVLIGHSLGGLAILKALETSIDIASAVILIGTPFEDVNKTEIVDFLPPFDWNNLIKKSAHFAYFYSHDDPYVPFNHAVKFKNVLPGDIVEFEDMGHFEENTLPELPKYLEELLIGE